ncbi:MAG: 50S ribosomal protein L25 [Spirochaetaceae bacterium]|nr:50S ribosomal protein L25 [Spirochaetaceae bacterium]MCF7947984.1 50S ribosomal protein L25 [Spirochaetia bacterium]MCF7950875.1 50S ribosomal protein L25 [Spirochaetaceae bacterium]
MKRQTLEAYNRTELKKGASGRLRRDGWIPAVIYGAHEPKSISVPQNEFEKKFHSVSENTIITLELGKEKHDVLVKDYQEDTIRGFTTHIDFFEIEKGKTLRTNIPVHVEGTPAGVKEGGLLEERLHEIEVECVPADIPEYFHLNVENLNIGDTIHVEDLDVPKGVKVLSLPEQVIVTVTTQKEELPEEGEEVEGEEALEGEEAEGEGEGEEGAEE